MSGMVLSKKEQGMFKLSIKKVIFMSLSLITSFLPLISYSGSGRGDFRTVYQGQSIDDLIINYMEKNNVPGMSLAIVQAPYITRVVGYGLGDMQSKTMVASHTVFSIGEITNAYTAVAIMQLKEEGKLNLDDAISKYLTILPKAWEKITIRELMTHSSGLPNYTEAPNFDYSKDYTPIQIIDLVKDQALLFEPGTQGRQSHTNSYLLGLIIEKASGQFYQDYVTKNQIERLGLKHTFFVSTADKMENETKNGTNPFKHGEFLNKVSFINPTEMATGYSENQGQLAPTKMNAWSTTFASTGIAASAEDISFWDIGLAGNILVKDPKDREFLYGPVRLKNGQVLPGNVGWLFPGHKGLMEIKGNIPGYSAFLSRFTSPDELLCVTLLANKSDLPDLDILARQIAGGFDKSLAAPIGAAWTETLQSPYSVPETLDRVAKIVQAQGGKVFARVDHSGEAEKAGQPLTMTQVLIVGNPAKGTGLMQANPAMAIDLPLRVMARQDNQGQVWLSFTDPMVLAKEYGADEKQMGMLRQMSTGMRKLCEKAVSADSM